MRTLSLIACSLFFWGCAFVGALSPGEQEYINRVKQTPLEFTLSRSAADTAWARAKEWISRFGPALGWIPRGDTLITTRSITGGHFFEYEVGRKVIGDAVALTVYPGDTTGLKFGYRHERNAINVHILASYMLTGELPYPKLVAVHR